MFEAHGWANVGDDADLNALVALVETASVSGSAEFNVMPSMNWCGTSLACTVCRNHRYERVFEVFRWLADHVPESYGVLYVRDQESGSANAFRVWRLARGRLTEHEDVLLSPCIPTIEDPYDSRSDQ